MDAQVLINGNDVSNYLISITREYNYCSISQSFTVELTMNYPTTIDPYAPIVIYEEGVKVLTGYVSTITKSAPDAKISIVGQDTYKRAVDYFVPDTYIIVAGQKAKYWIEFLLDLSGLTATFTDGEGPFLADGEEIGLDSVANIIEYMVQYAGWYGKVDENGDLIFGKLLKNSDVSITESSILSVEYDKNYDKTRNVVHIHGGVDSSLNEFRPIFASARVDLDYLPKDQIAVVANPYIEDQATAEEFAQNIINETSKPTFVKNLQVIGNPNIRSGEYIDVHSRLFTGSALVTALNSSFDENGYLMTLVLDDLCPRIVAHLKPRGNLYAGTAGSGVWEYNVYTNGWTDISTGLGNKYIVDLSVDNGLFIASTSGGVYTKILSDQWRLQNISLPEGASGVTYPAVYASAYNTEVNALANYTVDTTNYSLLYTGVLASGGTAFSWSGYPLFVSGIDNDIDGRNYTGLDMEGDYSTKYVVASIESSSVILSSGINYVGSGINNQGIFATDINGNNETTLYVPGNITDLVQYSNPSPDNTKIVFSAKSGTSNFEVYIRSVSAGTPTKITDASSTGGDATFPAWSPGADKIVYVYKSSPVAASELYVINIDGTNNTQVTSDGGTAGHPDWSSVSNEIVYHYTSGATTSVYKITVGGSRTLLRADAKNPSWTSQNKIIFTNISTPSTPRGWVMNSDGTGAAILTATNVDELDSDASYERLIYRNTTDNNIYLTATNFATGLFTVDSAISMHPAIIPNDSEKRFVHGKNDGTIRTTVFDGTNQTTIFTNANNQVVEEFNWDTSGEVATAVSHHTGAGDANNQILRITRTSAEEISTGTIDLLSSSSVHINPRISRDGSLIAFSRRGFGFGDVQRYHVYTVASTGGEPTAYTTNAEFPGPDGLNNGCLMYAWTPHNEIMFYNTYDETYYVNKEAFATDVIAELGLTGSYQITWHPSEYKYLIRGFNGVSIEFWLVDGDDIYQLSTASNATDLAWSHDGEHILYRISNSFYTCKADGSGHTLVVSLTSTDAGSVHQFTYDNLHILLQDWQVTPLSPRTRLTAVKKQITLASGVHPKFGVFPTTSPDQIRLLETIVPEESFFLLYSGLGFSEVNVDSSIPISIYGASGLWYSSDFVDFDLIISGATINDVFTRTLNNETHIYATGSTTIYDLIPSGTTTTRSITGTEIEGRIYGSGEIFFSVLGEVKKSTDNLETYVDISTGLPGNTITVLRTGE